MRFEAIDRDVCIYYCSLMPLILVDYATYVCPLLLVLHLLIGRATA